MKEYMNTCGRDQLHSRCGKEIGAGGAIPNLALRRKTCKTHLLSTHLHICPHVALSLNSSARISALLTPNNYSPRSLDQQYSESTQRTLLPCIPRGINDNDRVERYAQDGSYLQLAVRLLGLINALAGNVRLFRQLLSR
jgi:hypothetical protein